MLRLPESGKLEVTPQYQRLWTDEYTSEWLFSGPAGTAKTTEICWFILWYCEAVPNTRVLIARKVHASMGESVLVTWEAVLATRYPSILSDSSKNRDKRQKYVLPNGSEIVIAGLDLDTKQYSAEYALIYVNECLELTLNDWESLHRSLRWPDAWRRYLIGDCNPGPPRHWMKQRADAGIVRHIITTHKDNPAYWNTQKDTWTERGLDFYENHLKKMTGVRYRRLCLGEWCASEGLVWDVDLTKLIIPRSKLPKRVGYFAAKDIGFSKAGCLGIWAQDPDDIIYLVAQVYKTKKDLEWWAEIATRLQREFNYQRGVLDAEDRHFREYFGKRLRRYDDAPIFTLSDKSQGKLYALNEVRERMEHGKLFILEDNLREGRDHELIERGLPTCFEEEQPAYVWRQNKEGHYEDQPDPKCENHGCDMTNYASVYIRNRRIWEEEPPPIMDPWSHEARFGTPKSLWQDALRRMSAKGRYWTPSSPKA